MAQAAPKQTRTNRRRAQSFESLVRAGLTVIGQRGLYETTVEHITEAADVGKGTFYVHFASKEDLVFHLVRHGFNELMAPGATEAVSNGAPAARLAALIQGQLRALGRRRDLIVLLHQVRGLLILQPEARQRLRQEYRRYVQFLMGECQRALGSPPLGQAQCEIWPVPSRASCRGRSRSRSWSGRAGGRCPPSRVRECLCRGDRLALSPVAVSRDRDLRPGRGPYLPRRGPNREHEFS